MGKSFIRDIDRGWRDFKKTVPELRDLGLKVGVLDDAAHPSGGATIAQVAAANEFGTDRIPSRPAMRRAVDNNRARISDATHRLIAEIVDGKIDGETALKRLGAGVQALIRREITDLDSPPNAPSTIARKGSSNPLIDTGAYRQAITFEVTRGKAGRTAKKDAGGNRGLGSTASEGGAP